MSAEAAGQPTQSQAADWLDRWDRQQEVYIPDREQRFSVMIDIVEAVVSRRDPLIVDIGAGPGSLAHRVLDRLPEARVVGVDADPLLARLGMIARPDDRIRTVITDLREPSWYDALNLDRAPDAYVSSTALHWLNRGPLEVLLRRCGHTVAPGGVFVDADHLYGGPQESELDRIGKLLTRRRGGRAGAQAHEDWEQWWTAVEAAPELAKLVSERSGGFDHEVTHRPTVHDYLAALRAGGFTQAGVVWQYGDDRIIVAIKMRDAPNGRP